MRSILTLALLVASAEPSLAGPPPPVTIQVAPSVAWPAELERCLVGVCEVVDPTMLAGECVALSWGATRTRLCYPAGPCDTGTCPRRCSGWAVAAPRPLPPGWPACAPALP